MKKVTVAVSILALGFSTIFGWWAFTPSASLKDYEAFIAPQSALFEKGRIKVTFLGVSTLLIDDGSTQLLIDGFFTRPSLITVLTQKLSTNKELVNRLVDHYQMTRVQGIFVTHSHYDHALDVAEIGKLTGAKLYGSESTLNIGRGGGLPEEQLVAFHHAHKIQAGEFEITVLKSKHSPATPFNNDLGTLISSALHQPAWFAEYVEGESFDFLVRHGDTSLFIKPSANFIEGALDGLHVDALFLGVGLLGKQNLVFKNTYYNETVGKLKPKILVPLHWDNFFLPLSQPSAMLPRMADKTSNAFDFLIHKAQSDKIDFRILKTGQSLVLFAN